MKIKIFLITLMLVSCAAFAQSNSQTGYFSAGDTTDTYSVQDAKIVYFAFKDSSMTGTDSLAIYARTYSGGVTFYSPIAVHNLGTTTSTTNVTLLIPADGLGATFAFIPGAVAGGDMTFTGEFYIVRLNGVNAATPYTPKTRYEFSYEK